MCGILCEILFHPSSSITKDEEIIRRLKNRGPNCFQLWSLQVSEDITLFFCGAVLWTQGPNLTKQPLQDDKGVLLFNGDIFDLKWDKNYSDTEIIIQKFKECLSDNDIINVIKSLKGPFCIVYYDKLLKNIYFSRDRIGRGSLLLHKSEQSISISSVLGRKYPCLEIPSLNIHKLNIESKKILTFNWHNEDSRIYSLDSWYSTIQIHQNLPDEQFRFEEDILEDLNDENGVIDYINQISKNYTCKQTILKEILKQDNLSTMVQSILLLLEKSVKIRLETHPNKCIKCLNTVNECCHSTVGILFSGGLDCTILAYLADKFVPENQPIDLINVAFKTENGTYDVPDRVTGRQSYNELKQKCCSRRWVFHEVNVEKKDLEISQSQTIADLVYPRRTILDESLGTALWYAAWGMGHTVSPCRVLLLGSGADELFGGYTRHRNAYKRQGWSGLRKEMMLDWSRISYRNLARDNRVICDHGRIPRLPYLDEEFSSFILKLKPWFKCFPSEQLGMGVGDKLMLRLLAMHLGLTDVAILPKRALQFGTRIANKKQNGNDLSKHLQ
ncbi:asparagine synthetase domain-containing protein CG17486 isoform X1 [Pieris rapae]|uniref:asparagine synthetase domain-containing protein CG17486 isoform X1 n=1 Tax=Pieris rapae TaxID=64459 RepID=UPI001E27FEB7|nr:asparagine synthetase domain-containing protein CG17486 isoform X1 [Pieris rapae]